jgi:hypothetical protein
LCCAGCAPLPTIGLGVRSTFRSRVEPAQRVVDVLAGVLIGWAASRRSVDGASNALSDGEPDREGVLGADHVEPACADALACAWERDRRSAALARAGVAEAALPDIERAEGVEP